MDGETPVPLASDRPLDVEEAKFQLRAAAADVNLTAFVQSHPWTAVGLAMAAGALLGGSTAARDIVSKALVRKFMDMI